MSGGDDEGFHGCSEVSKAHSNRVDDHDEKQLWDYFCADLEDEPDGVGEEDSPHRGLIEEGLFGGARPAAVSTEGPLYVRKEMLNISSWKEQSEKGQNHPRSIPTLSPCISRLSRMAIFSFDYQPFPWKLPAYLRSPVPPT